MENYLGIRERERGEESCSSGVIGDSPTCLDDAVHFSALSFKYIIDSIKNPLVQNFVEKLVDDFLDRYVEVGYVVAGSIDELLALNQLQEQERRGQERRVEIVLGGRQ